tara:strand:+ start:566 stop:850 length:285 start_codon:yes stop_codon:yes gene_type:complete
MKCAFLFLALILISCNTSIDSDTDGGIENTLQSHESSLLWICHNPNSANHRKICTEDCLEPGNNSTFCWMFDVDQCREANTESTLDLCREYEFK